MKTEKREGKIEIYEKLNENNVQWNTVECGNDSLGIVNEKRKIRNGKGLGDKESRNKLI